MADSQVALARMTRGTSGSLSKTTRQTVPPFLQKLYELVSDSATENLIRWSENGDSFFVLDHERVAHDVLPRWFKHSNFASFVRQLNMYGFHKIPHLQQGVLKSETETEIWNFEHPNFRRGQPDLLCLITRKKQAQDRSADDTAMSDKDGATPGLVSGGFSPGTMVDINSIINGITAIKRHQATISADLNDLKASNQHLWQEALDARERHQKQQDTINRILKFLAGVFGNAAAHKGSPVGGPPHAGIPRKRQRLMIEGAADPVKNKPQEPLDGVEPMNDDIETDASTPTNRFVEVTPSPVPSKSASVVPETPDIHSTIQQFPPQPQSPLTTDVIMGGNFTNQQQQLFLPFSNTALPPNVDQHQHHSAVQPSYPRPNPNNIDSDPRTALTSSSPGPREELLQSIVNSPGSLQRLLNLLNFQQQQQSVPMPSPLDLNDPRMDKPNPYISEETYDPYSQHQQHQQPTATHTPPPPPPSSDPSFGTSPSPYDLVEPPDSQTLSLLHTDDMPDGMSFDPYIENAQRLKKTSDASAVITDHVNMMDSNIESLIKHLGLDPGQLDGFREGEDDFVGGEGDGDGEGLFMHDHPAVDPTITGIPTGVTSNASSGTTTTSTTTNTNTIPYQPTIPDFDFNVFLNELAKQNSTSDNTPNTSADSGGGPTTMGPPYSDYVNVNVNAKSDTRHSTHSTTSPQLSAFVDEVASQSGQSDVSISSPPTTRAGLPPSPTLTTASTASNATGTGVGVGDVGGMFGSPDRRARKRKSEVDDFEATATTMAAPASTATATGKNQTKTKRKR